MQDTTGHYYKHLSLKKTGVKRMPLAVGPASERTLMGSFPLKIFKNIHER